MRPTSALAILGLAGVAAYLLTRRQDAAPSTLYFSTPGTSPDPPPPAADRDAELRQIAQSAAERFFEAQGRYGHAAGAGDESAANAAKAEMNRWRDVELDAERQRTALAG